MSWVAWGPQVLLLLLMMILAQRHGLTFLPEQAQL
jgi:hypothetical protein